LSSSIFTEGQDKNRRADFIIEADSAKHDTDADNPINAEIAG
jgi:hypothetical protein